MCGYRKKPDSSATGFAFLRILVREGAIPKSDLSGRFPCELLPIFCVLDHPSERFNLRSQRITFFPVFAFPGSVSLLQQSADIFRYLSFLLLELQNLVNPIPPLQKDGGLTWG